MWALLTEASVMEGLVPVGRTPILQSGGTSSWGGGRTPNPYTSGGWKTHGDQKCLTHGKGQDAVQCTRKRVGGGQLGHLLVH